METWVTGRRQRLRVLGDSVPGKKNEYPRPLFGRRKGASVTKRWRGSETREEGLAPACKGGRTSAPVSALEMVMACQGRCYKAPQTRRLQTTESSSFTVPEAGRQESARQRARALHLFHAFLSPSGVAGNRWFVDASPPPHPRYLPLLSRGHLLPVSPCLWLFSKHIHRCWGLRSSCLLVRHVSTRDSDRRAITSMKAPFQLQSAMHRPAPSFCWQGSYGKEVAREKPTMGLRRHDFSP